MNSKPGPKSAQSLRHSVKNKRKPPRGMYLDAHDLNTIATGPPGQGAALLKNLDAEIVSLKRTVSVAWEVLFFCECLKQLVHVLCQREQIQNELKKEEKTSPLCFIFQVQNNKQLLSMHKHKTSAGIDMFRPLEVSKPRFCNCIGMN